MSTHNDNDGHGVTEPTDSQLTFPRTDWVSHIHTLFAHGKSRTFQLANALHRAKKRLNRGEWTAAFRLKQLPFSKRKRELLVKIGKHLGMPNAQTFAHLPFGWSVLSELARLDRQSVDDLAQAGAIHPAMTVAEAKALVDHVRGSSVSHSRSGFQRRLKRLIDLVSRALPDSRLAEREFAVAELRSLIALIESHAPVQVSVRSIGTIAIDPLAISLHLAFHRQP